MTSHELPATDNSCCCGGVPVVYDLYTPYVRQETGNSSRLTDPFKATTSFPKISLMLLRTRRARPDWCRACNMARRSGRVIPVRCNSPHISSVPVVVITQREGD
jgi:hypothetical protein